MRGCDARETGIAHVSCLVRQNEIFRTKEPLESPNSWIKRLIMTRRGFLSIANAETKKKCYHVNCARNSTTPSYCVQSDGDLEELRK